VIRLVASKDFVSGAIFTAIGIAAVAIATSYPVGAATRMGPGYFPTAVGLVLILLGAIKVIRSVAWRRGETIGALAARPLVLVPMGVVLFGVLLQRAGLLPAIGALVLVGCVAQPGWRWVQMAAIFAIAGAIASILWVYGLGFPIQSLLSLSWT
jgi:hypothetical protein